MDSCFAFHANIVLLRSCQQSNIADWRNVRWFNCNVVPYFVGKCQQTQSAGSLLK
jgi:hypothetical protein